MQGAPRSRAWRNGPDFDALIQDPQSSKHTFSHRRTRAELTAYSPAEGKSCQPLKLRRLLQNLTRLRFAAIFA